MVPGSSRTDPRIALPWIVRLRYAMAAGQAFTCLGVGLFLGIPLPLPWLLIPPALVALSNVWLATRARPASGSAPEFTVIWIFVLDTLCLTAALLLSGGPNNPFSLLYLVHITLAATILTQRQTWALGALACVCFGLLFWNPFPVAALEMHVHGGRPNLHLIGMWMAFAVASALVAMFSGRISQLLREREQSLLRMQEELAKKERLASLVTLAAGAAHELSTPLGTIAVVAKELEHYATRTSPNSAVAEDCRLIRSEVDRCGGILRRMSLAGAEPVGEALENVRVQDLLLAAGQAFGRQDLRLDVAPNAAAAVLRVPRHAIEQALLALVKNGLDASAPGTPVTLRALQWKPDTIRFEVTDAGAGMTEEALRRAGEPFFTTKDPGKGMGLGIFLVRTLAERLNGHFELSSQLGAGTRAFLDLPCQLAHPPVNAGSRT
ncbi:MAG: HAMP domain-containing histidine kinase [Bryobacterales bacterium]|nr:HAMP domain-containing histidine kinase [Bryobacterales bacterium]